MERARCERRHRHLEQWLARGVAGRHSERVPAFVPQHNVGTLTRSKSLELLDDAALPVSVPPCKSLDELEIDDGPVSILTGVVLPSKTNFVLNCIVPLQG